jgi:murein L,D-transpeptidase YcbB/YkuD
MMAALVRYRELAQDSTLVAIPPMPRRLRPGEPYTGVPALRRLLQVLGDYRDSLAAPILDTLYSGEVVEAVKRFQMRQGFTPDGVIGDSTRIRLSRPFEQRIRQMELTLERWRWMPRQFSAPPIIVNIPAFRLYAFSSLDLDERTTLAMNVVVGTAFKTETPVFADELEYLIFAPYWDVTPAIALKEIKPEALKNPEFLVRNRYELVEGGEPVPPWPENIARIGAGVRVRQTPGPHNALGVVKFIMPNDFQVYLHDTPSKALFDRTRRDASHGCIRLGDPFALAKFLLRDQPEWTDDRIRGAMNAGEPTPVRFRNKVPVYIIYATALAVANGDVFFYPDIYGHDRTLDRLLKQGYPYPVPAPSGAPVPAVASP